MAVGQQTLQRQLSLLGLQHLAFIAGQAWHLQSNSLLQAMLLQGLGRQLQVSHLMEAVRHQQGLHLSHALNAAPAGVPWPSRQKLGVMQSRGKQVQLLQGGWEAVRSHSGPPQFSSTSPFSRKRVRPSQAAQGALPTGGEGAAATPQLQPCSWCYCSAPSLQARWGGNAKKLLRSLLSAASKRQCRYDQASDH